MTSLFQEEVHKFFQSFSMFSLLSVSARLDLTVAGYIREYGKKFEMVIPYDLNSIILMFYQRSYKIFGIGRDRYNQFELKQQYQSSNDNEQEYDPWIPKTKWHHLIRFSKLCEHPDFISAP